MKVTNCTPAAPRVVVVPATTTTNCWFRPTVLPAAVLVPVPTTTTKVLIRPPPVIVHYRWTTTTSITATATINSSERVVLVSVLPTPQLLVQWTTQVLPNRVQVLGRLIITICITTTTTKGSINSITTTTIILGRRLSTEGVPVVLVTVQEATAVVTDREVSCCFLFTSLRFFYYTMSFGSDSRMLECFFFCTKRLLRNQFPAKLIKFNF